MIDIFDIQKIEDAANVVDVISDFIQLKKKGKEYVSLCPFHADRHIGSFKVDPEKNIYKCFSCGKGGNSITFLMEHAGYTYLEAIRYLGAKYGIEVEGSKNYHPKPCKPHTPPPPRPMLVLPTEYVKMKRDLDNDVFCSWLKSLPWNEAQRERIDKTLKNYLVGHGKYGYTIFWQMDESGRLRTGKMIQYNKDGHRKKEDYSTTWVHDRLYSSGVRDEKKEAYELTYFGMHLIDYFPDATINIVESEKTALICSIYFGDQPNNLWIACGGLSMLSAKRMEPFIKRGRKIYLYPDYDGMDKWQKQAEEIGYPLLKVQRDFIIRNWRPEDGNKADIADIIVRQLQDTRACKVQKVQEVIEQFSTTNPFFSQLVDRLGLTPVIPA